MKIRIPATYIFSSTGLLKKKFARYWRIRVKIGQVAMILGRRLGKPMRVGICELFMCQIQVGKARS